MRPAEGPSGRVVEEHAGTGVHSAREMSAMSCSLLRVESRSARLGVDAGLQRCPWTTRPLSYARHSDGRPVDATWDAHATVAHHLRARRWSIAPSPCLRRYRFRGMTTSTAYWVASSGLRSRATNSCKTAVGPFGYRQAVPTRVARMIAGSTGSSTTAYQPGSGSRVRSQQTPLITRPGGDGSGRQLRPICEALPQSGFRHRRSSTAPASIASSKVTSTSAKLSATQVRR